MCGSERQAHTGKHGIVQVMLRKAGPSWLLELVEIAIAHGLGKRCSLTVSLTRRRQRLIQGSLCRLLTTTPRR